jgi:cell division transport system ATP-binding protein
MMDKLKWDDKTNAAYANLDRETAQRIMTVFRDFNRVGVTTLIASHDEALMAQYANRTFRIDPGKFTDMNGRGTK